MKFIVDDDKHIMVIKSTSTEDAGLFTARAVNAAGQMACNGRVRIIRKLQ